MKNLVDMAAKKEARLEEVRAILDRAESEGRSLTAEENARYSTGMKEVKRLTEEYEAERDQQDKELRAGASRLTTTTGLRVGSFAHSIERT